MIEDMTETANPQDHISGETSAPSVTDALAYLKSRKLLVGLIIVFFLAVASVVYFLSQPIYRSEAIVLPLTDEESENQLSRLAGQFGGLASLAGINLQGGSSSVASIATLRSKQLIQKFIESENLAPTLVEVQRGFLGRFGTSSGDTLEEAVKLFDEEIRTVTEDPDTGLVLLRIDWHNRTQAAEWAEKLLAIADNELRQRTILESRASMQFMERELNATSVVAVQQAIYGLMETETKRMTLANTRPEYAFRVIDPPRVPEHDDQIWPNPVIIFTAAALMSILVLALMAVLFSTPSLRSTR